MYMVQFVRFDNQPDEEYYYNNQSDAMKHLNMFRDDDSGLYQKINLLEVDGENEKMIISLDK